MDGTNAITTCRLYSKEWATTEIYFFFNEIKSVASTYFLKTFNLNLNPSFPVLANLAIYNVINNLLVFLKSTASAGALATFYTKCFVLCITWLKSQHDSPGV